MTGLGALNLNLFGGGGMLSSRPSIQEMDLSGLLTPTGPADMVPRATPARLPPWDQGAPRTPADQLVREAMGSRFLVDTTLGSGPGSAARDPNDRELFILFNAVNKLKAIAERAAAGGLSAQDRSRFGERIERGLAEITARAASSRLEGAVLLAGKRLINHTGEGMARGRVEYETRILATGAATTVPEAFQGDRRFEMAVTRDGTTQTLLIDLADLGTAPRTLEAVTGLINTRLAGIGVESRITRVETTRPGPTATAPAVTEQRLRVRIATGERISFGAAAGDTVSGLSVAGGRTVAGRIQSAVVRMDNPVADSATLAWSTPVAATGEATAAVRALVRDGDGNSYVVADATGRVGAVTPKGPQDVVLQKIDSTGAVVWSRALGSAVAAQGFSLAIGPDGQLAVAGAVNGRADQATTTTGNGRDSFVAAFDAAGRDLWFHQQGAIGSDQAEQVAFASDGSVFIQGRTGQGIGGVAGSGDADVYVQAFSPQGQLSWTRVLGGVGADEPAGLVVRDGIPVVAWNSPAGPVLRALGAQTGADLPSPLDGTSLGLTGITALTLADDGSLVLTGRGSGPVTDQIRVIDAAAGAVVLTTDTAGEAIRAVAAGNGQLAVALGAAAATAPPGGQAPAPGTVDPTRTRVIGLSVVTGAQTFATSVAVNAAGPVSLALDDGQSRTLAALGLPQGDLDFGDAERLTDRTALRAGDHFFVRVNGNREQRVEIAASETFRSLAAKVNRVLGRDGRAEARSLRGQDSLVITPSAGDRVELRAGATGQDALRQLGLEPGVAMPRAPAASGARSVSDPPPVVALDLPVRADVSTVAGAKTLADALDGVIRRIRIGYREISTDPTQVELRRTLSQGRPDPAAQASIAAYNRQTAMAQDALRRLGGGF